MVCELYLNKTFFCLSCRIDYLPRESQFRGCILWSYGCWKESSKREITLEISLFPLENIQSWLF